MRATLDDLITKLAYRRAVQRHTPPLRNGESALDYLARAADAVRASAKEYARDPSVRAEAERRLAGGVG